MRRKLVLGLGAVTLVIAVGIGVLAYLVFHVTEGAYFDSNGVRVHYTEDGQGEPVILIHGIAANSDLNWRRPGVIRALARDFRVIAIDLRGHGRSAQPLDAAQYGTEMAEDVVRLMDHLGIEKAQVAGYSLGGFVLLKLVTMHPDRITSAAFCAAGWKNPEDPSPIPNPYTPPSAAAVARAVHYAAAGPEPRTLFNRVRSWVGDHIGNKAARKALKKSYPQLAVSRAELERIQTPGIDLIGSSDGFLPLAKDLEKNLPAIKLVMFDGANHFTLPFYPSFKKALRSFLIEHRTAGQ